MLTCGGCSKQFPLPEIVNYIQHKVNNCSKEVGEDAEMEEVDASKEALEKCVASPSVTGSGQPDEDDVGKETDEQTTEADSRESLKERLKRLDAETNTINSGKFDIRQ